MRTYIKNLFMSGILAWGLCSTLTYAIDPLACALGLAMLPVTGITLDRAWKAYYDHINPGVVDQTYTKVLSNPYIQNIALSTLHKIEDLQKSGWLPQRSPANIVESAQRSFRKLVKGTFLARYLDDPAVIYCQMELAFYLKTFLPAIIMVYFNWWLFNIQFTPPTE